MSDEATHAEAAIALRGAPLSGHLATAHSALAHRRAIASVPIRSEELAREALDHCDRAWEIVAALDDPDGAWAIPVTWDTGMARITLDRIDEAADIFGGHAGSGVRPEFHEEETLVRSSLAWSLMMLDHRAAAADTAAEVAPALASAPVHGWMANQQRAWVAMAFAGAGRVEPALDLVRAGFGASAAAWNTLNASDFVIALAIAAVTEQRLDDAARLLACARRIGLDHPEPFRTPMGLAAYQRYNGLVRRELDREVAARVRAEVMALSGAEAIALAQSVIAA